MFLLGRSHKQVVLSPEIEIRAVPKHISTELQREERFVLENRKEKEVEEEEEEVMKLT